MGLQAKPLSPRQRASSMYSLASAAFSNVNYRPGTSTPGLPGNLTLTSDTPNGILSGSIAAISTGTGNDWEATYASYNTPSGQILGLFVTSAAGNPFENNQAAAGGKVAVFMGDGDFLVYVFETNTSEVGYASILGSYTDGCRLYCSPFGLLSPIRPSTLTSVYTSSPIDSIVAICTKVPTASDLSLGIRLLAFPVNFAAMP